MSKNLLVEQINSNFQILKNKPANVLKRIKGGKTIVAPRVEEFISYIANASLVVTDSFHATAFSINLNVPFISIQWKMFNDRIGTILRKTGFSSNTGYDEIPLSTIYDNFDSWVKSGVSDSDGQSIETEDDL